MVSFVNHSAVRHHVSMSKSKAENRYWASDPSLISAVAMTIKIHLFAATTKSHNKILMSDGTACHRIKRSCAELNGDLIWSIPALLKKLSAVMPISVVGRAHFP